jgi:uncharacterized protein (DUF58 family)
MKLPRRRPRKLQVTAGGWWFLGLTILLGVVALGSGNNILYLIESLLFGALIVSGFGSDRAIYSVEARWHHGQAVAGAPVRDFVRLRNRSRWAVQALEIGEWREGKFHKLAFVPHIAGRAEVQVGVEREFAQRGRVHWDSGVVATAAPFGFARKLRLDGQRGERLVWPRGAERGAPGHGESPRVGSAWAEGEARPLAPEDDARHILWKLSARGGDPVVRPRRADERELRFRLRADQVNETVEAEIRRIAGELYAASSRGDLSESLLELDLPGGRRRHRGHRAILDALAVCGTEEGA